MKMNAAMAMRWDGLRKTLAQTTLAVPLRQLAGGRLCSVSHAQTLYAQPKTMTEALVSEPLLNHMRQIPKGMDATGFEALTNKIHISDYVEGCQSGDAVLVQGILYAQSLAESLSHASLPTRIVLSRDPDSDEVTVRFFVRRPDFPWGAEDPNDYSLDEVIQWDIDPTVGPMVGRDMGQ